MFWGTIKLKLIFKEYFYSYPVHKNYNAIFVPRNSRNILRKSVSFYLEQFQRYHVLKKMYNFWGATLYFYIHYIHVPLPSVLLPFVHLPSVL